MEHRSVNPKPSEGDDDRHAAVWRSATRRAWPRNCTAGCMLRAVPVDRDSRMTQTETLHRALARANAQRLRPRRTVGDFELELERETSLRRMERKLVEEERACVRAQARMAPTDPDDFLVWFVGLKESQLGQTDALFPWLAERANQ